MRYCSHGESGKLRIIAKARLQAFWAKHEDAAAPLALWWSASRRATWKHLIDVQRTFASAEAVPPYTVFNIKGNAYRLVAKIEYSLGIIYIKAVLTHVEYDKDKWK